MEGFGELDKVEKGSFTRSFHMLNQVSVVFVSHLHY